MRHARAAMMAAAALFQAAGAIAQDERSGVTQIPAAAAAQEVEQLSPGARPIDPATPPRPRMPADPSTVAAAQLSRAGQGVRAPAQLNREGPTARAPQPLSRPSDGRRPVLARVEGHDRCDPAAPDGADAECTRVIETRAAEFARPDPAALSPEQRLLVEQRAREGGMSPRAAPRGLGADETDASSTDVQSVVSTVLRQQQQGSEPPGTSSAQAQALDATAAAIVNAIVSGAGGTIVVTPQ